MSQSPPPPSSPKSLDSEFANKLNPEPAYGVRNMPSEERQKMVNQGKLYIDSKLPIGDQVIDGRGGRRRSKKRPTARRRRSSKARKSRKSRATRRR